MRFSKTSLRRALGLSVLWVTVGLTVGACGNHKANVVHGREVFVNGANGNQACSFCHTLRAALAAGTYAPDLDQDIHEDRHSLRLSERAITTLVRDMIRKGVCLDPKDPTRCMPPNLVTGNNAADVALFVARCANNPGPPGCRAPEPAGALAAKGQRLFGSLRCEGCHSTDGNVAVAPTVKGLAGSQVKLANGQTVTADDDYLTVAILAPDVQIVKGYKAGYMSSVIAPGKISVAQARAIIAYIKTLK